MFTSLFAMVLAIFSMLAALMMSSMQDRWGGAYLSPEARGVR